jgi:hypothetical protein
MKHPNIALLASLAFGIAVGRAEDTKHFPAPEWRSWLRVDYPARFEMDPESLQGEAKWWARFKDPDSDFSFELIAYGFIGDLDLLRTVPGYTQENMFDKLRDDGRSHEAVIAADAKQKNIGDYFRVHILPAGTDESKFPGYERFISRKNDSVIVYFLSRHAYTETSGRCYQQLTFRFPEGTYEEYRGVIDAITASAKPPYQTNESGTDQPGTGSASKSEDHEKTHPDSEPRSADRKGVLKEGNYSTEIEGVTHTFSQARCESALRFTLESLRSLEHGKATGQKPYAALATDGVLQSYANQLCRLLFSLSMFGTDSEEVRSILREMATDSPTTRPESHIMLPSEVRHQLILISGESTDGHGSPEIEFFGERTWSEVIGIVADGLGFTLSDL